MNAAYAHLLLCHLPTLGVLFALLLLAAGALRHDRSLTTAALVGFAVAAATAAPTYLSGEGARAVIESLPAISDDSIDRHRDDAWLALLATGALGVGSLVALVRLHRHGEIDRWLHALVWLLALGAFALLAWTSARGGTIRHPEIARAAPGQRSPRSAACAVATHSAPAGVRI